LIILRDVQAKKIDKLELHKNLGLRTSANGILGDGETCSIREGIKIECHTIENVGKLNHINNI